jgi:N-acetylneuraminate synthase
LKAKIIAEIGINHDGNLDKAKKLIDLAGFAGCDYVKFQKRNPDISIPENQKYIWREQTPWGESMYYIDYKHKLEFGEKEFNEIDQYCKYKQINWFASVWDKESVDFMKNYTSIMKIPSAKIDNLDLCQYARENCDYLMISTGMSSEQQIIDCIGSSDPDLIFHTNSSYPTPISDLHLEYINWLQHSYPDKQIGYSGHEYGLITTIAAYMLGAKWIERHITLDRNSIGSDHFASIEPTGLFKLVKDIRDIETSLTGYKPRSITQSEIDKHKKLRGY